MKDVRRVGSRCRKTQIREEVDEAADIPAESNFVGEAADRRRTDYELGKTRACSRRRARIELASRELNFTKPTACVELRAR